MAIAAEKKTMLTVEAYLERERVAPFRSEYADGEVFAMSGGTVQHNVIAVNLSAELRQQLKDRPCYVFSSDLKIWIAAADTFTYPDVSALCGEIEYRDDGQDVITNPSLIAEVLSDSTEAYDRGEMFARYRTLPSFREYLLLSQKRMRAELYVRQEDGSWILKVFEAPDDVVEMASIHCSVHLGDLYHKVTFAAD